MAWSNVLSNQMVSFTDAQTSVFTLKSGQSIVTSNQCMTKLDALTKYNLNATSMSAYTDLQLVPKSVWVSASTFLPTGQTLRNWFVLGAASNGDIYAAPSQGDIYKQPTGTTTFVSIGQPNTTGSGWQSSAGAPNGDVYICGSNNDILKQAAGTNVFVGLNQQFMGPISLAAAPNGDIYVGTGTKDIYKQAAGTSTFLPIGIPSSLFGNFYVCVASNGDLYAAKSITSGDIYKRAAGTSTFVATGQTPRGYGPMAAAPNGDIYSCVYNGDIYIQAAGTSTFVGIGLTASPWRGMCAAPNGNIYACVNGGDIWKKI